MSNKYDLEYIDKLRIHELRDFAKKLGVNSPTTLKKEELICRIMALVEGNSDSDSDNKYIKNDENIDFYGLLTSDNSNILADLLGLDKSKDNKSSTNDNANTMVIRKNNDSVKPFEDVIKYSFVLRQNDAKYDVNDTSISVYGYVDIHPTGYGILRHDGYVPSEKDSYLTSALIKKYNLKKGQHVFARAKKIIENKPYIVYEIEGIDDNQKACMSYDDMEYNGLGEDYYIDKFDFVMNKGERHYIEYMSIDDAYKLGLNLVEENATRVKLINIKARPEDNYKTLDKLQVIHVPFNKSEMEVVNTVELVLERIKREIEYNKQNVLIVYNFSELIRIFNIACEGCVDFDKINSQAINKIYNILYLSKYIDKDKAISVICIDKNGIPRDLKSLMELELLPLFNKCQNKLESK